MPNPLRVSGEEVIQKLEKPGFNGVRQRGSHESFTSLWWIL